MTPTKRGVAVFAVCTFLYGLAWQTQIGWFYVAIGLVGGAILVNISLPWLILRPLSASRSVLTGERGRPADIFEDHHIHLAIELHNRYVLPNYMITLREHCPLAAPGEQEQGFIIGVVAPRGRVTASYDVLCYQRGVHRFGPVQVETSAPFGLFHARRILEAPFEVTVYPKVLPMSTTFNSGFLEGRTPDTATSISSGEFRGAREFQQGDQLRNVHWRNTARRGQLMAKEFDRIPQGEVRLAFNEEPDLGSGRDTTLEYAIKIAAATARRCFLDGRPFRMWSHEREEIFSNWHSVLQHLALLPSGVQGSIGGFLSRQSGPGLSLVIISAADKQTLALLGEWRQHSREIVVVLLHGFDPSEDPNASDELLKMGLPVVPCGIGDLQPTLDFLSKTMSTAGPPARTLSPKASVGSSA